jgi:hypothetical protein
MSLNNSTISLLASDDVAKFIFEEIVKRRSVMLKELTASLGSKLQSKVIAGVPADSVVADPALKTQVESVVARLKKADLIEERSTPIADFNSYYVTSSGLNAEKQLRLTGIGLAL